MKNGIKLLRSEFNRIKGMGLIKSLREGPTGVGYTFESLLNKQEDQESKPDYYGIELKCKLGYSRSALTLFNCVPNRFGKSAINYIFEKYSYYRYGNPNDYRLFERKIYSNYSIERYGIEFKLKVDYRTKKIVLKSYCDNEYLEDVCNWDFKTLENKLKTKLNYLAIIKAYPYRRNDGTYFKYVKLEYYKLKDFFEFLRLIDEDIIFINFYIRSVIDTDGRSIIKDHGVGFRIKSDYIEELFYKF